MRLLLLLSALAVSHCDEDEGEPSGATCPTDSTLTYANFGQAFVESYCVSCHSVTSNYREGAPSDHNFDTVEQIRAVAEHIDARAAAGPNAINTIMPPSAPRPTEAERRQLGEWLACGAP